MNTTKHFFNTLILILITCTFSCESFASKTLSPETQFSVWYPSLFDSENCDQVIFSGPLQSLSLPNIPLTKIVSNLTQDFVMKNYSLDIKLFQQNMVFSSVKIIGKKTVLQNIEDNLTNGIEVKLTEFPLCAQMDSAFQLIEAINFIPPLKSLAPELSAKIEYIKKNDDDLCTAVTNKSLAELVTLYNPNIDLASIEANVSISPSGWDDVGNFVSKTIKISFNKKTNIWEQLASPKISIIVPSELVYAAIHQLHHPEDTLRTTMDIDCKGDKGDDPMVIYDLMVF
jgi:hypothetical protein